jgi:hypothetical protein
LKGGAIIKAHEITDDTNQSKAWPEYDVAVIEQDSDRGITSVIYKNCVVLESLGSISDFFEKKLRGPTKKDFKNKLESDNQDASLVLLLCLDGISEKGIIIGGLPHPKRKTTLTKNAGEHLEGEYNGINWQINKDGEFTLTFKSPSDNSGKYANSSYGGSFIKISKDGSIEVSDGNTEKIKIDKTNETISIESNKDLSITSGNNVKSSSTNNTEYTLKDLLMKASGMATIEFAKDYNLKIGKIFGIKSNTIDANIKTMIKLKCLKIIIDTPDIEIGKGGQPAVIQTTLYRGTGNLGIPVVSSAIGPFSSAVKVK